MKKMDTNPAVARNVSFRGEMRLFKRTSHAASVSPIGHSPRGTVSVLHDRHAVQDAPGVASHRAPSAPSVLGQKNE